MGTIKKAILKPGGKVLTYQDGDNYWRVVDFSRRDFQKFLVLYDYPVVNIENIEDNVPEPPPVKIPQGALFSSKQGVNDAIELDWATDDPLVVLLVRAALEGDLDEGEVDLEKWKENLR